MEKLASIFFHSRTQTHIFHLGVTGPGSYSMHKALNEYYDGILDLMDELLEENDNSIFFFLDAHWEKYWPLLDELKIIKKKNIKPVIAIHDFYVPDENGNAKFGFDSYNGQNLNFEYIKSDIEEIYGKNYEIRYSAQPTINSGLIYIYPNETYS
jgi:hypothetical protein